MAGRRAKALKEVTGTERRNINLDAKLNRVLGAYAKFHGLRDSDVVNAALTLYLRGFTVSSGGAEAPRAHDEGGPAPRQGGATAA